MAVRASADGDHHWFDDGFPHVASADCPCEPRYVPLLWHHWRMPGDTPVVCPDVIPVDLMEIPCPPAPNPPPPPPIC